MYSSADKAEPPLDGDGQNQGFRRVQNILKEVNKLKYLCYFHESELTLTVSPN